MDILRKEINAIYAAQQLDRVRLDMMQVAEAKKQSSLLVDISGGCSVITDASCDRCYIYAGAWGRLMGLTDSDKLYREVNSSDEDEIYNRMHPEDLVDKRMLEYEFFRQVDRMSPSDKLSLKATCRIRLRDACGRYRMTDNSTQILGLSYSGKFRIILCRYELSPDTGRPGDIMPRIIDTATGDIEVLDFADRHKQVLTMREKQILKLIQQGRPSKMIAAQLGISIHTVSRHRQNIIDKLSVGNSMEAVLAATAMKLL